MVKNAQNFCACFFRFSRPAVGNVSYPRKHVYHDSGYINAYEFTHAELP